MIYIERIQREKVNGTQVFIGIHPSNVVISKIKIDKDRINLIDRKFKGLEESKAKASMSD